MTQENLGQLIKELREGLDHSKEENQIVEEMIDMLYDTTILELRRLHNGESWQDVT